MQNERKQGVVLSYIQVILTVVVNIVYVPVLLHYLGQSEYGLYQIVGSFFGYISVFESSMDVGVLRNYCKALNTGNDKLAETTLYTARRIYRWFAVILGFAGILFTFLFQAFYRSSFSLFELREGSAILVILFFNMIVALLGSIYLTIATAFEKFFFLKTLAIIIQVLQPCLVILFVMHIPYAMVITIVIASLNMVSVLVRWWYCKYKLKIKITNHGNNKQIAKEIITLSATLLVASIADQIFWKTDQVILGKIYNTAMVAIYAVGSQIYMIYMQFGTVISGIYFPKLSKLYASENGLKKSSDLFIQTGRVVFYIILLILSGFIVFGRNFFLFWVGRGYDQAYYVAIVVMIPFSIDLAQNLGLSILQLSGQYSFRAKMYFLAAILNILSTIVLSIYMGIVGAALSTSLTMFVTSGLIMNWFYDKKAGLDIKLYWQKCFPIIITAFCITIIGVVIRNYMGYTKSLFLLIAEIIIYAVVYCLIMYFIIMDQNEKSIVQSFIKAHLRRK